MGRYASASIEVRAYVICYSSRQMWMYVAVCAKTIDDSSAMRDGYRGSITSPIDEVKKYSARLSFSSSESLTFASA